jgi:hypothetical protein
VTELSPFETTAEISIAFAGFISIFLVLAARDGRFSLRDTISIRTIVAASVASVFYAVLPVVLYSLGIDGQTLWRISSGVVALASAGTWASMSYQVRTLPAAVRPSLVGFVQLASNSLGVVSSLSLLANALAWPWAPSGGVHLMAVWMVIGVAAIHFVVLIFQRVLSDSPTVGPT